MHAKFPTPSYREFTHNALECRDKRQLKPPSMTVVLEQAADGVRSRLPPPPRSRSRYQWANVSARESVDELRRCPQYVLSRAMP